VSDPNVTAGAGEDRTLRRWRAIVTVGAWLVIIQAALSFLGGIISIPLSGLVGTSSLASQLGPLAQGMDLSAVDRMFAQLRTLNIVQVVANAVTVAAGVGLLRRARWGWYALVIISIAEAAGSFIFGIPALEPLLSLLDAEHARSLSVLIALLVSMIPVSIIAVLMAKPVIDQFERPKPAD
jgi:hypothetical protein